MLVIVIQRGLALPVAALASAARRLSEASLYRTSGLPVVFTSTVTFAAVGQLFLGGAAHG